MPDFTYTDRGQAQMIDADDKPIPIRGVRLYGVQTRPVKGSGVTPIVLGLVQINQCTGKWRAVAATGDTFPQTDSRKGAWRLDPGRNDFRTRREAAVWLLGAHDAQQAWFREGEAVATT